MFFYRIFVCVVFYHFSFSSSRPTNAIILQIQKKGVIGAKHVHTTVAVHGLPLTTQEVTEMVKPMSNDTILPPNVQLAQTSPLRGHTIFRSQECILVRGVLRLADHIIFDNEEYLTLDHNDTWKVHGPKAQMLKLIMDQNVDFTRAERIVLYQGCMQLLKELNLGQKKSEFLRTRILIPLAAVLILLLLIVASFYLSVGRGSTPTGGVLGSIIHYPRDMTDLTTDVNQGGYRAL